MGFEQCVLENKKILMEGALGERLKREFGLDYDPDVAMAGFIYESKGREALKSLWMEYMDVAVNHRLPFMATTPTRRANKERVGKSRFSPSIIKDNMDFLKSIGHRSGLEMYAGGLMGCRGDAYAVSEIMDTETAKSFHLWQAERFAEAGADFLFAGIMPEINEALGMAQAMGSTGLPYIISFMIRKDGRLIDGTPILEAIEILDRKAHPKPLGFMVNCVHPAVLIEALSNNLNTSERIKERFLGIQANTSLLPPEALDGSKALKCSDAEALADEMLCARDKFGIKIFGGCCGTDKSHMEAIARRLCSIDGSLEYK